MNHRFLHTLVFSSVMALEGCATAPPVDTAVAPSPSTEVAAPEAELAANELGASASSAGRSSGSSSPGSSSPGSYGSGGGSTRSPSRSPEPAEAEAAAEADVDTEALAMRMCEIGWGTTKSGRRQVNPWDCTEVSVDGVERTECTDANGRCVQP